MRKRVLVTMDETLLRRVDAVLVSKRSRSKLVELAVEYVMASMSTDHQKKNWVERLAKLTKRICALVKR